MCYLAIYTISIFLGTRLVADYHVCMHKKSGKVIMYGKVVVHACMHVCQSQSIGLST